jgi:hypothetical protein
LSANAIHRRAAILDHARPRGQHRALFHLTLRDAAGGRGDQLDFGDRRIAEPTGFAQACFGSMDDFGKGSELGNEVFGQWLDVPARQRAKQHHFQQFVIAQGIGPGIPEPVPQPFAMTVIMRRFGKSGSF